MNIHQFTYDNLVNLKVSDPEAFSQIPEKELRKAAYNLSKESYKVSKDVGKLVYSTALKGLGLDRKSSDRPENAKSTIRAHGDLPKGLDVDVQTGLDPITAKATMPSIVSDVRAVMPQTVTVQGWSIQHLIDQFDAAWPQGYSVVKPRAKDSRKAVYQHLARLRRQGHTAGDAVVEVYGDQTNILLQHLESTFA